MSVSLRSIAGAAALVGAAIMPAPALGQERASHDLVWEREQGAETCPDRATFVDSIRTRLGYDPFQQGSVRRLEIRLSRAPARWRAELRVLENGLERGSQRLEAEGPDCSALFAAIVAVASVTLEDAPPPPRAEPSAEAAPGKTEPERAKPEPPPPVVVPNSAPPGAPRERHQRPSERKEPLATRWAVGLEFAQDYQLMLDKDDVCGNRDPSESLPCYEQDGTPFNGMAQPGTNNRMVGGLLLGNPRLLGNVQYLLTDRLALELRMGWAIDGGPTPVNGNRFLPLHVEPGVRYWLADRSSRLRGYVGTGLGIAQFDAKFQLSVRDCGLPSELSDPRVAECMLRQAEGTPKTLDVYQRLGLPFVAVRIGMAFRFAEDHALTTGLAVNFTLLSYGLVFDPTIGYSAAF